MPSRASRTRTIRQRVSIPATPEQVYAALTNARLHAAFTGAEATGAARVGHRFTAWDGYIAGKHLLLQKPKRIVQSWETTRWPAGCPPSTVEIRLRRAQRGTELIMTHSDVPASRAADLRSGWVEYYWKPLKAYFSAAARQK
jgi:activator of HSP90 ATPase